VLGSRLHLRQTSKSIICSSNIWNNKHNILTYMHCKFSVEFLLPILRFFWTSTLWVCDRSGHLGSDLLLKEVPQVCLGKEPGFGRVLIRVSSSGGRNEGLESLDSSGPTSICKRSTGGERCCWWGNFLCVVCATFGFGCNLRRVLIEGEQQRAEGVDY
jgi:hypothetical protein